MVARSFSKAFTFNETFFRKVVHHCPDAIIGVDRAGMISIFNEAAEKMTGWQAEEVLGKLHVTELYYPATMARHIKKSIYDPLLGGIGRLRDIEATIKGRDGVIVPIKLCAFLLEEDGVEIGSVGFFHDMTRTKELEQISITDPLTGLHNRYHFYEIVAVEMGRSRRYERPLTLVYLDVDRFKLFNDRFGHQEGDRVLRLVGKCCRKIIRHQDYAFRLGGDEFSLLLVETGLEDAVLVADRFRSTFNDEWGYLLTATGKSLKCISLSLGAAEFIGGSDDQEPEDLDDFIKRADMAMYSAKRAGGDRVFKAETKK